MSKHPDWDLPAPHILALQVEPAEIDAYNHVNNAVYVTWCDRVAWEHSAALGLPMDRCVELDRGMAVVRTIIDYVRPALPNDSILIGTWLIGGQSKLRVGRRFQIRRATGGETLARAEIDYACIELSSGRPVRWPPEFRERYVCLPEVIEALRTM